MSAEHEPLLHRLGTERSAAQQLATLFTERWAIHDPRAHAILDSLAVRAAHDTEPDAMDLLLTIIDSNGLSRPALRRILIATDDVDEAEQSTLAVVAMKVGQYRNTARFATWLHQVASNEAKMLIRARSRRPSDPVAEVIADPFVARLSTLLADRDLIVRALAELPDDFRLPLELREVEGLDYDEVAATLGIPVGTVRSRLSRARTRLAAAVRDEMPDDAFDDDQRTAVSAD